MSSRIGFVGLGAMGGNIGLPMPNTELTLLDDDGKEVPPWPERLWGDKHDPSSNFPKHVLKRCLGHDYTSEELGLIGERADLDTMAERCPESFAPFLERARAIAAHRAR